MANEFIARKGLIALENSQVTGSLNISGSITANNLSGTNTGDQDLSSLATKVQLNTSSSTLQSNIDTKASIAQLNTSSSELRADLVANSATASFVTNSQTSSFSTATGVEDNADVTDTANVTSAGALMDSELSEIATVKALTKAGISGSFTTVSASFSTRVTANDAKTGYTDAAVKTKLDTENVISGSAANVRSLLNIEDGADVTDTSNVTSAGALMDSELAEIATVKALTAAGISGSFNAASASFSTRVTANDAKLTANTSNVTSAGALMDSELAEIATVKALTKAGISGSFTAASASFSTRVTANDAKVSYTDAAVTSVINTAGVISGSAQFGSSDNVTFGTIEATSLNVTSITSSIVTSSIIQTEGSNIFGDTNTDTQTFNGHITASGNISASGRIITNVVENLNVLTLGDIDGNAGGARLIINQNGHFDLLNATDTQITGETILLANSANDTVGSNIRILGHITSSGNISSSGDVHGDIGRFSKVHIDGRVALDTADSTTTGAVFSNSDTTKIRIGKAGTLTSTIIHSTITASGDISASGNIIAPNLIADSASFSTRVTANDAKLTANTSNVTTAGALMDSELSDLAAVKAINQGLTTTSNVLFNHITASSNISASGTITTSGIVSSGDIHLGANNIQITQILSNGSTTRDLIGYDTTDTAVVGNPSTNKVKLVGDVTASGNISSSGTITMLTASIGGGTFTSTSLASAIAGGGGGVDTTGTPADNQIAVFTDADTIEGTSKLTFSNNDLLIHSSNADNSGIEIYGGVVAAAHPYISPVGSQTTIQFGDGDTGHILDLRRNKIGFDSDSTNTYIQADSDDPENLEIHADNNIELKADNLVTMDSASIEHRLFDTGSTHLGANGAVGDIVKFGGTTTVAGGLYYLKSDGTWGLAKADAVGTATSSLAVAVGTDSTTDGMCLRGFVNPFTDPGAGTGNPVYLSDTSQGRFQATAPDSNNDVVRILGYQYGTDLIYFNPSNDFIVITA